MFDERPIVGHIRFSFYGITDTRLKPDTDGTALARLYDETRMARRFHLFETLTLPSLKAQTDQDFRIVVMTSEMMPERFKARLRAVMADVPNAVIDFSVHARGDKAFRSHMLRSLGPDLDGTAVHFRLDDDDALGRTYIADLRRISQSLPPTTHITFPRGLILFPARPDSPEGAVMEEVHYLAAMGLAVVCSRSFAKNPFQMMHGIVWKRWPVVSYPRGHAFIRTQHFSNDTLARQDKILIALRTERLSRRADRWVATVDAA
ncbi:MAG: hypothetical protein B7Y02_13595, partial [Rhodobacterales bacterium 17-64-5]